MRLVLLYHGEPDGAAGRCIGRSDLPLTAQARQQAQALAADWPYPTPDALIASSRRRAHAMLAPFARRFGRLPQVEADLDEQDFGDWDGESWTSLLQREPQGSQRWLSDWINHAPPGGESFADVSRRMQTWLTQVLAPFDDDALVLLSTHAGPIRALICHALEVPLQHALLLKLSPGHVSALRQRRGRFELSYCNASRFEACLYGDDFA